MAKAPNLPTITGQFASSELLNRAFRDIEDALENTVSLDGSIPNAMLADFDMNGFNILNAGGLSIDGVDVFALVNKTTISPQPPSGGVDGDLWFKVST